MSGQLRQRNSSTPPGPGAAATAGAASAGSGDRVGSEAPSPSREQSPGGQVGSRSAGADTPPVSVGRRVQQVAEQRKSLLLLILAVVVAAVAVGNSLRGGRTETATVFTPDQLSEHRAAPSIYVGLLGEVYDVTSGAKHYGPGGGYAFFAGRDASRAFITGDFAEEGLVDDVSDLSAAQLVDLAQWASFYRQHEEYHKVGVVAGRYYDSEGNPTAAHAALQAAFADAQRRKAARDALQTRFPSCNSRWRQGHGGEVWCSQRSGGVERDWVGVPRLMMQDMASQPACVCVNPGGGDLGDPKLRQYDGCPPDAERCRVPET